MPRVAYWGLLACVTVISAGHSGQPELVAQCPLLIAKQTLDPQLAISDDDLVRWVRQASKGSLEKHWAGWVSHLRSTR